MIQNKQNINLLRFTNESNWQLYQVLKIVFINNIYKLYNIEKPNHINITCWFRQFIYFEHFLSISYPIIINDFLFVSIEIYFSQVLKNSSLDIFSIIKSVHIKIFISNYIQNDLQNYVIVNSKTKLEFKIRMLLEMKFQNVKI